MLYLPSIFTPSAGITRIRFDGSRTLRRSSSQPGIPGSPYLVKLSIFLIAFFVNRFQT
jgi:hypothetical protein